MLREASYRLLALAYPRQCLLCQGTRALKTGLDVCTGCLSDLPRMRDTCTQCAANLLSDPGAAHLCGRCLSRPPPFIRTVSLGPYEGGFVSLITGLKFNGRLENGRLLGQLLGHHLRAHPDCARLSLLPVPLHPARLRARGFNQAQEVAHWAAREAGIELLRDAVRRIRNTRAQTGLNAKTRRKNLSGAFEIRAGLRGKRVAIIDDVMTTGSTVAALAKTVRLAGCSHVEVWCCARASLQGQPKKNRAAAGHPV